VDVSMLVEAVKPILWHPRLPRRKRLALHDYSTRRGCSRPQHARGGGDKP
jgi:hypothetical protein